MLEQNLSKLHAKSWIVMLNEARYEESEGAGRERQAVPRGEKLAWAELALSHEHPMPRHAFVPVCQ